MGNTIDELGKRRRRRHLRTVGAVALGSTVALAASVAIWGQYSPGDASPDVDTAAPSSDVSSDVWSVTEDACADPDVRSAVDSALASGSEGPHNALLATPDEVNVSERARQATAWHALTDHELAFQLCLRLSQDAEQAD